MASGESNGKKDFVVRLHVAGLRSDTFVQVAYRTLIIGGSQVCFG